MDQWVSPDSAPTTTDEITVQVPNRAHYIAALRGLLLQLIEPEHWQSVGGITAVEAAEWAVEIYESFEANYNG